MRGSFIATPAQAKRVALVIGNSAYKHANELPNPRNDATDLAAALKGLGFKVIDGTDLDKAAMDRKIREFADALSSADAAVFFYAGHGLQVGGVNYLVPVDAELTTAAALDFEMIRFDLIQRTMEREAKTNILFLDACRDNPLARNLARAMGTRGGEVSRGLAAAESGVGTLISFSTQPGNVALDGEGRNSPFAAALVKYLTAPNEDLAEMLVDVRKEVMRTTDNKQVPWEHSALTGRFYFKELPEPVASPSVAPAISKNDAVEAWTAIKDTASPAVMEAFVKRFGDTLYGDMARARLQELQKQQVVAVPPPAAVEPSSKSEQAAVAPPLPSPTAAPQPKPQKSQDESKGKKFTLAELVNKYGDLEDGGSEWYLRKDKSVTGNRGYQDLGRPSQPALLGECKNACQAQSRCLAFEWSDLPGLCRLYDTQDLETVSSNLSVIGFRSSHTSPPARQECHFSPNLSRYTCD